VIEKYSFGKITINGKIFSKDILLFADQVQDDWWRKDGHKLHIDDLSSAIDQFKPTVVVVGTGKFGLMKVLPETISFLETLHIRLIAEKTPQACKIFNQLSKTEQPMGAFHLTC